MRVWWVVIAVLCVSLQVQAQAPPGFVDPHARQPEPRPSFEEEFGRGQMALGRVQLGLVFPRDGGETIAPFRVRAPAFTMPLKQGVLREGDQVGLQFEIIDFESLDMTETLRFAQDFFEALHFSARYDDEFWGAQAGLHVLGIGFNELRAFTPVFALRAGHLDKGFVMARVDLRGFFAFSTGDQRRRVSANSVVSAAGTLPISGSLSLQSRLRLRDYGETCPDVQFCDFKQRDLWLTMGFEAAFDVGVRITPLYVGFGIRQVFEHRENGEDIESPGQQFILVIEPLLGFAGKSQIW